MGKGEKGHVLYREWGEGRREQERRVTGRNFPPLIPGVRGNGTRTEGKNKPAVTNACGITWLVEERRGEQTVPISASFLPMGAALGGKGM